MFERTPCKHPVIVLKDMSSKDVEFLLSYMYGGEVSVGQSDLPSLIKAAETLQIKGLVAPDDPPSSPQGIKTSSSSASEKENEAPSKRRRLDNSTSEENKENADIKAEIEEHNSSLDEAESATEATSKENTDEEPTVIPFANTDAHHVSSGGENDFYDGNNFSVSFFF